MKFLVCGDLHTKYDIFLKAIEKFETLGMCHNGEIICPTEIDTQVTEIMHYYIL